MISLASDYRPKSVPDAWRAQPKATTAGMRAGMIQQYGLAERAADKPMHSIQLVQALSKSLPRDARLIVDGGYIAAFGLQYTDAFSELGIVWVGSTGHLGVGVSFAAASKLAEPNKPVVALMGDGSFGLSGIEFDTAVRHGLPLVVVIANDAGWGEVRDGQRRRYGNERVVGTNLAPTRYDELAKALGGHGELVSSIDQVGPAVERCLKLGKPSIINVLTDRDQRSLLVTGMPWPIE
jgi:acetolactate synthase-1/2/3 large subunit